MTGATHPDWDSVGRDWPNREASHFLRHGTTDWHYQRMGSGPVLVLLHGTGASTHSWRDLMPILAQHYDVVAPDLPGHAFSRPSSRHQLSLASMATSVTGLLAALEVTPHLLVGHSAGAAIALQMVLFDGIRPGHVIGLNAALAPFRGVAGVIFPPMAKLLALNPVVPWVFSNVAKSRGQVRRLIDGTGSQIDSRGMALYERLITRSDHVDGALSMMALWDLEPLLAALPRLETPTCLLAADTDKTVPPDEARQLAAQHEAITFESVPGLGHLMHEEDPPGIARRIIAIDR